MASLFILPLVSKVDHFLYFFSKMLEIGLVDELDQIWNLCYASELKLYSTQEFIKNVIDTPNISVAPLHHNCRCINKLGNKYMNLFKEAASTEVPCH